MSGHVCGTNVRGVYFGEPMVGTKVGGGDAVRGDMTEPAATPPRLAHADQRAAYNALCAAATGPTAHPYLDNVGRQQTATQQPQEGGI